MDATQIKQLIKTELPAIMQEDIEIRQFILQIASTQFAGKTETESRFDRILEELRRDREEQSKTWEKQDKRWEENDQRWKEQNKKWEENQKVINEILQDIRALSEESSSRPW